MPPHRWPRGVEVIGGGIMSANLFPGVAKSCPPSVEIMWRWKVVADVGDDDDMKAVSVKERYVTYVVVV